MKKIEFKRDDKVFTTRNIYHNNKMSIKPKQRYVRAFTVMDFGGYQKQDHADCVLWIVLRKQFYNECFSVLFDSFYLFPARDLRKVRNLFKKMIVDRLRRR